jgi:hypothetical protein
MGSGAQSRVLLPGNSVAGEALPVYTGVFTIDQGFTVVGATATQCRVAIFLNGSGGTGLQVFVGFVGGTGDFNFVPGFVTQNSYGPFAINVAPSTAIQVRWVQTGGTNIRAHVVLKFY